MIKVLIVDDDSEVRTKALRCLARPDVHLSSAADGKRGLDQARQFKPDLVVCDVDMPQMDGFELLTALRTDAALASTQVMMLTAMGSRDSMRLGMTLGADDYLTKPFTDEELVSAFEGLIKKSARVKHLLDSAARTQEESMRQMFLRNFDGGVTNERFRYDANLTVPATHDVIDATVVFCGIRNFTALAEKLTADELARLLAAYFERMCEPLLSTGVHHLKMLGDGLLAVFADDAGQGGTAASRALQAALAMQAAALRFAEWMAGQFTGRGLIGFDTGFGLHCGLVALPPSGHEGAKVTTPTGSSVHIAARLQSSGHEMGWPIAASRDVLRRVPGKVSIGAMVTLSLRGGQEQVEAVEVLPAPTLSVVPPAGGFTDFQKTYAIQRSVETATLHGEVIAQLQSEARQHADLAARAVKDALDEKLASLQHHTFQRDEPPLLLAGYRILRRIGAGGMSTIYLANRETDGDLVVLKVQETEEKSSDHTARFMREYALLAGIRHPNVIRIFNQGFSAGHIYIAMEYFENGDLRGRMPSLLDPAAAVRVVREIASALSAIHTLGIVHRDLKPENLMVRADGSVVLADFGIAKSLLQMSPAQAAVTVDGELVGSPSYMSPEQIASQPVTPLSDLYSLGALFFELLTGNRPYKAATLLSMLSQHAKAPPPKLPFDRAAYQPYIDRLMAKRPEDRYASAEALLADLSLLEAA